MIEEKTIKEHCRKLVEEVFINGLCECDLSGISIGHTFRSIGVNGL